MKTLKDLIREIETSEKLREDLKNLKDKDAVDAFLKERNCSATAEELAEYLKSQKNDSEGELSDDDASSVSGGVWAMTYYGWMWLDDTVPESKTKTVLPKHTIIIEEDLC